jgi:hypothetical protein
MVSPGKSVLQTKIKTQYNKGNTVGWTNFFHHVLVAHFRALALALCPVYCILILKMQYCRLDDFLSS